MVGGYSHHNIYATPDERNPNPSPVQQMRDQILREVVQEHCTERQAHEERARLAEQERKKKIALVKGGERPPVNNRSAPSIRIPAYTSQNLTEADAVAVTHLPRPGRKTIPGTNFPAQQTKVVSLMQRQATNPLAEPLPPMTFTQQEDFMLSVQLDHPINPSTFATELDPAQVQFVIDLQASKRRANSLRPKHLPSSRWITEPKPWPPAHTHHNLRSMDHQLQQFLRRSRIFFLDICAGQESRVTMQTRGLYAYMRRFAKHLPAFMEELFPDTTRPNLVVETVGNGYAWAFYWSVQAFAD